MNKPAKHSRDVGRLREHSTGPLRRLKLKVLVWLLVCALPLGGSLTLMLTGITPVPLVAYVIASLLAFGLYAYDKQQARAGLQRTPEKLLHSLEVLGGWPGALVAQQLLRHKTRKTSYQVVFWLIVAAHQVVWIDVLFLKTNF